MVDALSSAATGLYDAAQRANVAASNIANVSSTNSKNQKYAGAQVVSQANADNGTVRGVSTKVEQRPEGSEIDLAKEIVDLDQASISYQANAKVVAVVNNMQKKLIDTMA